MPRSSGERLRRAELQRQQAEVNRTAKLEEKWETEKRARDVAALELLRAEFSQRLQADEQTRRFTRATLKIASKGMWIALVAAVASVFSAMAAWYLAAKP